MEANERVILKSIELFTQYGIRQVTMDQIAEEVGMSKRTIYELCKDKDTLVWECLQTMQRQHLAEVQEILAGALHAIDALYKLGRHGEQKKSAINKLFFEDIRKHYPVMWQTMMEENKPGVGSISYKILKKGIDEEIFLKEINVEIVDTFIAIMMETFYKKDMFPKGTTDKDLMINIILPYYLGISTGRGKKLIAEYFPLLSQANI